MNRAIKFRAWDKQYKSMSKVSMWFFDIDEIDTSDNLNEPKNIQHYEVMQFTGLHDKNGKEIYEGDILSYPSMHTKNLGELFNNVVEFATGQSLCGWRMRNKSCVVKATPYKFKCSEVIGNIYENPELIKPE